MVTGFSGLPFETFRNKHEGINNNGYLYVGKLETSEWKPRLEGYDFLAKIKEEAEDVEGEGSEPWEDTETSENEYDEDEKTYEDSSTTSEPGHDHNTRFHAAFHAKKQSRLDQRRRIMQKPVHEAHTEL